jgi:hypothetical protein
MEWGTVRLMDFRGMRFGAVAYAAAVGRDGSSPAALERIGRELGTRAGTHGPHVCAPLLGTGAGGISPRVAAKSLEYGFLATAPDDARLVISALDAKVLDAANRPAGAVITHIVDLPATDATPAPAPPPSIAPAPALKAKRTRVFISYSSTDAKWLTRLQLHLRPLERDGALIWDDTRIKAGVRWREEIRRALDETKVAVLLVSAAFIASDFINTEELPPLLKAAEEDGATILPVIVSASRFDRTPSLSCIQAVNDPRKPLAKLPRGSQEDVLNEVAVAVEEALER